METGLRERGYGAGFVEGGSGDERRFSLIVLDSGVWVMLTVGESSPEFHTELLK